MLQVLSDLTREQFDAILSLAPLAITVIEMPSQKYVYANENYCKALRTKLEPHELVGRTVSEVLCSPNAEAVDALHRVHTEGQAVKFGTLHSTSVGATAESTYWTGALIPLVRNEKTTLALALLTEITAQVRAQQEAERNLLLATAEKQKSDEFTAMAVHELRTPLTTLKILTQMLLAKNELPHAREKLSTIDRQSNRLVRLINDLLDSVKSSSGQLELKTERVRLAELLDEVPTELSLPGHDGIKTEVEMSADASELMLDVDRDRLRQVVQNLLQNAFLHSNTRTPVQLRLNATSDKVRFEVVDNGKGIPAEELEKIFDRYYRRPAEKRSSGLGLGLYLSRRFIEGMGGRLWAESAGLNRGSTFIVELPRSSA